MEEGAFVKAGYVKIHFHNVIKSLLHLRTLEIRLVLSSGSGIQKINKRGENVCIFLVVLFLDALYSIEK